MCFTAAPRLCVSSCSAASYSLSKSRRLHRCFDCFATAGGILLPETPNSLIERGHLEEAQRVLRKIRGTENIRVEYEDILLVRQESKPWSRHP